ncbi:quinoprotein relay system zinc metallohydrolase 2 [Methylotenera sp.]|uniref:quinoprotein relay system zinc metallohydrolase 2 n=1 Tax=Methylotenera sp. TaxID=2051956 RepID=UPI002731F332|nr:quinoprotein relay system zinc metallohydrolase 2 [Methylotenera sp.]MDP2072541.1 quinoprotein relay system zinc metallohydrolase 2 [Methylotenera sp.]MDP3006010.1 quinoprotein relay system zinc metallohydrolase 2 [Methylotenera sp.]MDP3819038.1 quinoprotein relay system zinc metallohydrolase 2 [Methylotenera sp.]
MRILMIIMSMLVFSSCSHAQIHSDNFALESLGDGIYVHHGVHLDIDDGYHGDICNASFIVGSKGVAVIDTGGSLKVGQQLREAIRKVTPLPVLYVINTHVHPDHIYGNAAFLADKPQFVGHDKLATTMELRHEAYAKLNARLLGDDAKGSELVKPSMTVKSTLELDLGDRKLMLTAHPVAHTNTDVSVMESKAGTLFAGDLLFIERTPVLEGDIKGLIAEIEKLKSSPAKQVVPGHGPVTKNWVEALNNAQRYLNVLLTDIRASIKKGESMESAMNTAAASEKDKWVLFDIANRRNVNTIYPALEWE